MGSVIVLPENIAEVWRNGQLVISVRTKKCIITQVKSLGFCSEFCKSISLGLGKVGSSCYNGISARFGYCNALGSFTGIPSIRRITRAGSNSIGTKTNCAILYQVHIGYGWLM